MIRKAVVALSKVLSRQGLGPFLEAQFARLPAGGVVLNVGAGGEIEKHLRLHADRIGFTIKSFDVDPDRNPDLVGDAATYDFEAASFDAVVIAEVLEHIQEPQAAVRNLHRAMKPGAPLVLTTPFLFPIHDRPYDFYRYTKYGLAYLMRDFDGVEITARNTWAEALLVQFVRLIKERHKGLRLLGPVIVLLAFALFPLAWVLGRVFRTDFVTSGYLVSARKASATADTPPA